MNVMTNLTAEEQKRRMRDILDRQKARQIADGIPSAAVRIDRIDRAIGLLVDHAADIAEALNADFGARSKDTTAFTDVARLNAKTGATYTIQLDPGVFGTLGVGGGFAVGAATVRPRAEVWIIYGDGSSAYSLNEFDTFVRHGYAPIAVIGLTAVRFGWRMREPVTMMSSEALAAASCAWAAPVKPNRETPARSEEASRRSECLRIFTVTLRKGTWFDPQCAPEAISTSIPGGCRPHSTTLRSVH
jgi:hypothetical protein